MKKTFAALMLTAALTLSAAIAPVYAPPSVSAATVYSSTEAADYARQVTDIVNRERAAAGLAPVTYSERMSQAAQVRASEIRSTFSHTRLNGTSCFTALKEAGVTYRSAGENIAYGQRTPEEVMDAWMNSSGHRANILGQQYTYIGVGALYENGTWYWTQFFAAADQPDGAATTTKPTSATTAKPTSATTAKPTSATTAKPTSATTTQPTSATATQPTSATATQPTSPTTAQADDAPTVDKEQLKQELISRLMTVLKEKWEHQGGNCQ